MTGLGPLTRRRFAGLAGAALVLPRHALAGAYRDIGWEDLIPPGIPYGQIIADGEIDRINDTWSPVFDANAVKLNSALDGAAIRLPGFMIPLDVDAKGVTGFLLVPYLGACIHVPPPPPNQLVLVDTDTPWPSVELWEPVVVSGILSANPQTTKFAEVGYHLSAESIEAHEW